MKEFRIKMKKEAFMRKSEDEIKIIVMPMKKRKVVG